MIVTLLPHLSQTFISVYLLLITDFNFTACYCNFFYPNGVYVSSSVLSHCSIKHDDDDDDDDDDDSSVRVLIIIRIRFGSSSSQVEKIWVRFGFGSYILSFEFCLFRFYMSSAVLRF